MLKFKGLSSIKILKREICKHYEKELNLKSLQFAETFVIFIQLRNLITSQLTIIGKFLSLIIVLNIKRLIWLLKLELLRVKVS